MTTMVDFKGIVGTDWTGWQFEYAGQSYTVLNEVEPDPLLAPGVDTRWLVEASYGERIVLRGIILLDVYAQQLQARLKECGCE